jgi:hypothetical protein
MGRYGRWGGNDGRSRRRGAALLLAAALAWAAPAGASDQVTVNHTDGYVDPSIAAAFVTTPNICTEPIGTQGTSLDGCNALGDAAVLAATGSGPDAYFEPHSQALSTTNAFVPGNVGSTVGDTGYSTLFVFHKYDLFGRAGDRMGPFTREEILFLEQIPITGGGITNGQTTPGENTRLRFISVLLTQPEGATSVNIGGHTFDFADLPTYQQVTGFTSGKLDTVNAWCDANVGALICSALTAEQKGDIYAAVFFPQVQTQVCGSSQNDLINSTNCLNRDQWVDQTVSGYIEAWGILGGDAHFAENFRSQIGYNPAAAILDSGTLTATDQRIQQSVELSGAFTTEASDPGDAISPANLDDVAGRQTFEQAMRTLSHPSLEGINVDFDQMVSQDVNGYFLSCLNCDTATTEALNQEHAFTPAKLDLTFMPYAAGWQTVPTVIHAP